jgi:adenylate cyclase
VTNALDSPPPGRKADLFRWLAEEGRFAPDAGRLLEMLCEKLTALRIPIARATTHVRTLHPLDPGLVGRSSGCKSQGNTVAVRR